MPEIGKRIRTRREELGITQEELASRLGNKSKTTIAKIENGTNDIVQSKVIEFAQVLDTTPAYLMGWLQYDERTSGKEASDDKVIKMAQNYLYFHGPEKKLIENYKQLSDINKKKVVDYSENLLKIQKMEEEQLHLMPDAAHDRTDIKPTAEMKKHDDDLMDNDEFWGK